MGENARDIAVIGPVTLMVSGITPVINGIGAWFFAGTSFLGCTYDGCIPSTILLYATQIMVGLFGLGLGIIILKGEGESSIGALWASVVGLIPVIGYELFLPSSYGMLLSEYIPNPFYFMIWFNAILILVGAVITFTFWREELRRNSQTE